MRAPPHILSPVTPPGSLSPWGPHGVGGGRPRALVCLSLPGADQTGSPAICNLSLKKCIQADEAWSFTFTFTDGFRKKVFGTFPNIWRQLDGFQIFQCLRKDQIFQ